MTLKFTGPSVDGPMTVWLIKHPNVQRGFPTSAHLYENCHVLVNRVCTPVAFVAHTDRERSQAWGWKVLIEYTPGPRRRIWPDLCAFCLKRARAEGFEGFTVGRGGRMTLPPRRVTDLPPRRVGDIVREKRRAASEVVLAVTGRTDP